MNPQKYTGVISPVILAVVVGMYGYWAVQRDLVSSRPTTPGEHDVPDPFPIPGVETFHSRMWEDPLAPSYAHWKNLPESEWASRLYLVQDKPPLQDVPAQTTDGQDEAADSDEDVRRQQSRAPTAVEGVSNREAVEITDEGGSRLDARRREMSQFFHDLVVNRKQPTLCLPVFVPGGPYAEDCERRMRIRYAIVTALAESGYHLKYARRMSYAVPRIYTRTLWGWQEQEIVVPVKLFRTHEEGQEQGKKPQVLVLWINEDQLGERPLLATHRILHELFQHVEEGDQEKFFCTIIGPARSGTLELINREADIGALNDAREKVRSNLGPEEIEALARDDKHWFISSYSSVEREGFRPLSHGSDNAYYVQPMRGFLPLLSASSAGTGIADNSEPDDSELLIFSPRATKDIDIRDLPSAESGATRVVRVIGTDRELAGLLLTELCERGASRRIVLITEHDTSYGRAIEKAFRDEWGAKQLGDWNGHAFRVLRGIDGNLPRKDLDDSSRSPRRSAVSPTSPDELPEIVERPPAGRSQYDYLRRLRRRIEQLEGVTAIGVVGSDVYDKLLVLSALKPHFPDCVFFTTDLDAIFVHPDERPHTRNLLIASHYGLSLCDELQQETPPFRDSYQTASFLATRLALHHDDPRYRDNDSAWRTVIERCDTDQIGTDQSGTDRSGLSDPAVYVVGRDQMHALDPGGASPNQDDEGDSHVLFHPGLSENHGRSPWHYLFTVALAVIAGVLAWSWIHRDTGRSGPAWLWDGPKQSATNRALFRVMGVGGVLCLLFLARGLFGREAASIFDAYSTWATKLLYTAAGIVALLAVVYLTEKFRRRVEAMEGRRQSGVPRRPVFGERQQVKIVLLGLVLAYVGVVCVSPHPHEWSIPEEGKIQWRRIGLITGFLIAVCGPIGGVGFAWWYFRDAICEEDASVEARNPVLGGDLDRAFRLTLWTLVGVGVIGALGGLAVTDVLHQPDTGWHPAPISRGLLSRVGDWIAIVYAFGAIALLLATFLYLHFWCREFSRSVSTMIQNATRRHLDSDMEQTHRGPVNSESAPTLEDEEDPAEREGAATMQQEFGQDLCETDVPTEDVPAETVASEGSRRLSDIETCNRKWENEYVRLRTIGKLTAVTGGVAPLLMLLLLVLVLGYHPWLSPVHMPASLLVLTTLSAIVFLVSTLTLRRHFARERNDAQSEIDMDLSTFWDRLDDLSAAGDRQGGRPQSQARAGRRVDARGAESEESSATATLQREEAEDPEALRLRRLVAILKRKKARLAALSDGVYRSWNQSPLGWILGGGTTLALVDLWIRWWSIGV